MSLSALNRVPVFVILSAANTGATMKAPTIAARKNVAFFISLVLGRERCIRKISKGKSLNVRDRRPELGRRASIFSGLRRVQSCRDAADRSRRPLHASHVPCVPAEGRRQSLERTAGERAWFSRCESTRTLIIPISGSNLSPASES